MKNVWLVCTAAKLLFLLTSYLSPNLPPRLCTRWPQGAQLIGARAGNIWLELLHRGFDSCSEKSNSLYHTLLGWLVKAFSLKMQPLYSTHDTRLSKAGPGRCKMHFSLCERETLLLPPWVSLWKCNRRKAFGWQRLQGSSRPQQQYGTRTKSASTALPAFSLASAATSSGGLSIGAIKTQHSKCRMNI